MTNRPHPLPLETRSGLPEALRVLVTEYPRDIWEEHDNFEGLVKFWMERHVMFRRLVEMMQKDVCELEGQSLDPSVFRQRVARLGNMFVSELHIHHTIEDHQYFPTLQRMEPSLTRGFEILDHDHHALETHLEGFTQDANAILQSSENAMFDAGEKFHTRLQAMESFLNRHLTDEEELVVPIILKNGFEA